MFNKYIVVRCDENWCRFDIACVLGYFSINRKLLKVSTHNLSATLFIRLFYVVPNLIYISIDKGSTDRQCRMWVCFSCLVCVVSNLLTRKVKKVKKMESDAERIEKINKILFFFYVHESCNNELIRRQIILRYLEIKLEVKFQRHY